MRDEDENKKVISNLRKQIAELREKNDQLLFIIQNLPGNVYWKDRSGIYMGCNNNLAKIIKIKDCNDIAEKSVYSFINKSLADKVVKNDEELMKNDKEILFEEKGLDENGNEAIYLTKKIPLHDKKGNVTGLLGTSIDITDRKRAMKLQAEKEAAEKSAKIMEKVSGFIAHEMKTPLAGINLQNDLLGLDLKRQGLDLNSSEARAKINDYHEKIKFSVRSADNVISMLLTKLSNLPGHKLGPSDYEFLSMKKTINTALTEYPCLKYERKLINWDQNIPLDFKYFGCKDLTKHVLFNLLKNALRSIKERDNSEIFITLQLGDKCNYLIFRDTGKGMTKEEQVNLFQQFYSNFDGGSGLGLSFCKTVMNSYGGNIICKSRLGEYTEFTLSFPKDGGREPTLKQKIAARATHDV